VRAGNDAVCAGGKRALGTFNRDVVDIARADQIVIKIGAVERGQNSHRKDFKI